MTNFRLPTIRTRVFIVGIAILGLLVVGAIKAAMLQVGSGEALRTLSKQQVSREIEYSGDRGNILDRNGNILSTTVTVSSIFAEPRRISSPAKVVSELNKVLPIREKELTQKLNSKRSFVWILRRADPNTVNSVLRLNLQGIKMLDEKRRFYPNHALLGQVLGLVSIDGEPTGGVEKVLDERLQRKVWVTDSRVDAKGDAVRIMPSPAQEELNGADVILTIDRNLQHFTEEILLKTVQQHKAKGGWAIVVQPKTGEILALANVPLFNPNKPSMSQARNQAISRTGEPGSVFKIVTFASALENGVIQLDDLIDCENGKYNAGFMTISDVVKRKVVTITEAFKNSSNIGTFKIAQKNGANQLYQTIKKFGFGEVPGLGLPEEASGFVPPSDAWGKHRFANISFGYGLKVTSLQMLMVASAIANNGILVAPKLFDGKDRVPTKRVISERTAGLVKEIMHADTENGGTGVRARIKGVEVAGKTGTTEKVDPETGKYSKKHNLSSFVGFAPVADPQIAAIVVIDEPSGVAYGGFVAAPAWRQIVSAALQIQNFAAAKKKEKDIS